jgi:lysine 2-monooxygenase
MTQELDVAIIGGGVAGAYCGWRLTHSGAKGSTVGLFEYSDRIGGRLYTKHLPGMPHVAAELGGMRYIPSDQPMVSNLIDSLGLQTQDFLMGNPAKGPDGKPIGDGENIMYLRGRHLRVKDMSDPTKVPYALNWVERGKTVNDLQVYAMNLLVPNNQSLTLAGWMEARVFGQPLYTFGFWNLMARTLSAEAYAFMRDAGGYDANVANASAVTNLPATEYASETGFKCISRGYQALPETLYAQFLKAGGQGFKNHRLARISREQGLYRLEFRKTVTGEVKTEFGSKYETRDDPAHPEPIIFHAKSIILAMPRRSLELVEWDGWEKPGVRNMLGSVLVQHAFKLLLGYNYPWWRTGLGLVAGRSITDLPVRQIYYFGTEQDQPGGQEGNTRSLLMASYNDISTVPFWKGLEKGPAYTGGQVPDGCERAVPLSDCLATKAMVESAHQQILQVHAMVDIDLPYTAVYHDWSADPYGGGWHEWKAGYRYDQLIPQIRQPVPDERVFICGEAYSNNQGWVEGSLQTAEHVLLQYFDLPWPEYLRSVNPDERQGVLGP